MNKLVILTAVLAGYVVNDIVGEIIPPAFAQDDCSIYGSIDGDGTGYGEIDGSEVYVYDLDLDIDHSLYISC
jgi:hypothetical protein